MKSDRKLITIGDRKLEVSGTEHRISSFDSRAIDETARTIEFPCSSEYPVVRWWGTEILDHNPRCVNLSRFRSGASCLFNHNPSDYHGVIESARLENERLFVRVRFDTHPDAEKVFQSILSGVLRNVSIGYSIEELKEDPEGYRVTRWTPLEVSIVTIPADPTVGVGRSNTSNTYKVETMALPSSIEQERDRLKTIIGLCERYRATKATREGFISSGISAQDAERQLIEAQRAKQAQQELNGTGLPGAIGLTGQQQRQYSLCKAIYASFTNDWSQAGFEREISQELSKRMGRSTNGIFVPLMDLGFPLGEERATYAVGASATGGVTVETSLSTDIITFLRNRTMVLRMGASQLSNLSGFVDVPRQTGVASTYWVGEGGNVSQSESTFDKISLTPRTVGLKSKMTRLMLLQSSIDIENFVRADIATSLAVELDRVAINGSGTSNQPAGLLHSSMAVPTISLGANGGSITWDALINMENSLAIANADIGSMGFLMPPAVRGKLKTTLKNPSASNSDWIWESGSDPLIGDVNGYPAGVTNQVPANLTKGTGTNLSALVFGNWSDVLIGGWGNGLDLLVSPYGSGYDNGDVEIRGLLSVDIKIRRTSSFVKILDAVTA